MRVENWVVLNSKLMSYTEDELWMLIEHEINHEALRPRHDGSHH